MMLRIFSVLTLSISFSLASNTQTIIRVRTVDGSVIRVPLNTDDGDGSPPTLSSILSAAGVDIDGNSGDDDGDSLQCQLGSPGKANSQTFDISPSSSDRDKTASVLGLKHGSMITILPPPMKQQQQQSDSSSTDTTNDSNNNRYNPYPDLAKSTSFSTAARRARALSRGVSRGSSYESLSRVRETMHVVEPQSDGPLSRVYVCRVGAARFQQHCIANNTPSSAASVTKGTKKQPVDPKVENRIALLFGTINKERVDQSSRKKARTSLSSTHEEDKMCGVAKVHAVWEPPFQKPPLDGRHYDEDCLLSSYDGESIKDDINNNIAKRKESATERAVRVANYLGMQPIGWIFSYADENRHEDGDALPVHGRDAIVGSKLQIETMKLLGREDGGKFITLTLDGRLGATEAFQLSDVCVQMVAEDVLCVPVVDEKLTSTRFIKLKDPVLVSGEETKRLDSVLLLVNTAMLSHVGLYSGGEDAPVGGSVKKGSGTLLVKTRKRILSALENSNGSGSDGKLLQQLCDFDTLLALDAMIGKKESEELCGLVRKYARGQKRGTVIEDHLKLTLQSVLGG
ncbi:predicted protein [Thalassiosira pseudonana CCMP1335]|uniref:Uncharacterized protein n=1 Tax=Thalassiosira pseudonana TaxID=35128 RepID=B8C4Y9_THAPS|nr:predicted protein [Thalassiosira pseudonana CCMP1335]EED91026.1 predicted protein [Thalassiosira pseudonana CCMP1335]|eukprot:scaffold85_cov145-Alexandrium_tamarense.AAC.65